jgi:hypothetical protein
MKARSQRRGEGPAEKPATEASPIFQPVWQLKALQIESAPA